MFETRLKFSYTFKNKELFNIALFSVASCISLLGTSAYNFAISLYVLKITNSGLDFATTLILSSISIIIITPIAGVFADKLDKKIVSIVTDVLNSLLLILVYLLVNSGYNLSIYLIYISTFFLNLFTTIYNICINASKPSLVYEKKLISLTSLSTVIESSSSLLGPVIGGAIFVVLDIKYFILFNGISFILSAFLQALMDFNLNSKESINQKKRLNFYTDIKECISYLNKRKELVKITIFFVILNFFIGFSINVPMPYIINTVLKLKATTYGVIQSTCSIGAILGAIMVKRLLDKFPYIKIMKSSNIVLSLCMISIGFSVQLKSYFIGETALSIYYIVVMILTGLAISFIDIPLFNFLQLTICDEFRGRVLSLGVSASKIFLPVALILSGLLINHIPPHLISMIGGVIFGIFSILYMKIK